MLIIVFSNKEGQDIMQNARPTYTHSYEIMIEGHVSGGLSNAFRGLEVKMTPEGHTIIAGQELDQSALFGILLRIRDFGLPLLSVVRRDLMTNKGDLLANTGVNDDHI